MNWKSADYRLWPMLPKVSADNVDAAQLGTLPVAAACSARRSAASAR
jgi:hypothetical protein